VSVNAAPWIASTTSKPSPSLSLRLDMPRPRVLLLRALGLGGVLTGVPAYRAVRRAFPGHEIVLAAPGHFAELARLTGAVDRVLPTSELEPLHWPHDAPELAIDLHGRGSASRQLLQALAPRQLIGFSNGRWPDRGVCRRGPLWLPDEHEVHRWCRLLTRSGIPADPTELDLDLDLDVDPDPQRLLSRPWIGRYLRPVIVHPGAAKGSRRWPPARFAAVAAHLDQSGHRVLITGSAGERELAEYVAYAAGLPRQAVVAGQTTVLSLAELVAESVLVVSGDTGVAHLATALRTPSVVLFGPVPPYECGPPPDRPWHVALHSAASPGYRGDPCGERIDPALAAISVDEVVAAAGRVLESGAGTGTELKPTG
jgi:ADP-heptose:LPS heptosyltransferase